METPILTACYDEVHKAICYLEPFGFAQVAEKMLKFAKLSF
jgi:hypothetical protein